MSSLIPVFTILTVAAITPGPNNLIVMTAATRGGFWATLPSIAGVVVGGLLLMLLVWAGIDAIFETVPDFKTLLRIAGAAYLVWLGGTIIWGALQSNSDRGSAQSSTLPSSMFGVAVFQFLNPKSWVLIVTVTAAMSETTSGLVMLAVLMGVVMTACLSMWALAGSLLANCLKHETSRRVFDITMGVLLVASAGMLFR